MIRRVPALLMALALSATASADPPAAAVELTGTGRLTEQQVRNAIGKPPRGRPARVAWSDRAIRRIVALYESKGFSYARAWAKVEADGKVQIDIDEGHVLLVFPSADTLSRILFRVDTHLPDGVFHYPMVRRAVDELKTKYGLLNAYWRVIEVRPLIPNRFGELVLQRQLQLFTLRSETFGFGLSIGFSSSWGILSRLSYSQKALLFADDRVGVKVELALPYRQMLFDDNPRFQWVHGGLSLGYRAPPIRSWIAPQIDGATALSRYARADLALKRYFVHRVEGLLNAVLLFDRMSIKLGGGAENIIAFGFERLSGVDAPPLEVAEQSVARWLGRAELTMSFDRDLERRDQRNEIGLTTRLTAEADGGEVMTDTTLALQLVYQLREHAILLRTRGVFLAGNVRFWDDVELAGDYQRAFFDNRYWVHEALQVSLGFRLFITPSIKLGVFHDVSLFLDRTRDDKPIAVANAFGPAAHFLLFDLFAFDLFYGFGFAPVGFSHNISFSLKNAF